MLAALHDADLIAIGGLGAAGATIVLAVITYKLASASGRQIGVMRQAADDQIKALKETTDKELALVRKQIEASVAQNDAVRQAARAQLQPIVFAHGWGPPLTGGDVPPGRIRLNYYLRNEGVGPALDVEHGISVGGVEMTIDDAGARYRTLSVGESAPPGYPNSAAFGPLHVMALNTEPDLFYWARFSNVFGDRFEVRNFPDASRAAGFRRLTGG
jgi:hypothetical protein